MNAARCFIPHSWIVPSAVRYPRGSGPGARVETDHARLPVGKGIVRRRVKRCLAGFWQHGHACADGRRRHSMPRVADMRFVKPLDEALLQQLAQTHELLVTLEENAVMGGAGSAVASACSAWA